MADATNATHQTDLNTLWKQLDAIFQTKLAKLVEQRDRDKFNQLTAELGFSNTQQELLFDSIGTFMVELASNINLSAPFRHPFAMNRGMVAHAPPPRHAHHTVSHSLLSPIPIASDGHSNASLPALYAIPNNRNESLSTRHKRKRSDMDNDHDTDDDDDDDFDFDEAAEEDQASDDDDDDDDYGVSSPPKKKKRRVTRVEELWQPGKDRDLSVKETRDLEKDGIYVIEQITTHRKQGDDGKKLEYKVKWEGYPDETWEPALHLNESLIEDYWRKRGMRSDPALAAQQLQRMEKKKKRKHKKPTAAIGEEEARKQTEQKDDNSNTNNLVKKNKSKRTPKQKQKAKPQSAAASKSASKAKAKSRVKSAKKKRNEPGEGEEEEDRTESEEEEVALPHCCTQCGKSFKSAAALGGHMAGAHKELYKNGTLSKKTRARKKRKRGKAGGDGDAKRKTPVPFWEDSDDETQLIVIDP